MLKQGGKRWEYPNIWDLINQSTYYFKSVVCSPLLLYQPDEYTNILLLLNKTIQKLCFQNLHVLFYRTKFQFSPSTMQNLVQELCFQNTVGASSAASTSGLNMIMWWKWKFGVLIIIILQSYCCSSFRQTTNKEDEYIKNKNVVNKGNSSSNKKRIDNFFLGHDTEGKINNLLISRIFSWILKWHNITAYLLTHPPIKICFNLKFWMTKCVTPCTIYG